MIKYTEKEENDIIAEIHLQLKSKELKNGDKKNRVLLSTKGGIKDFAELTESLINNVDEIQLKGLMALLSTIVQAYKMQKGIKK